MIWTVRHRRTGAAWLAALVLFTQLLTAAYACQRPTAAQAAPTVVAAHCGEHGPAAPDPAQPLLCKVHCDPAQQAPNPGSATDHVADALPLPVLLWVLPEPVSGIAAVVPAPGACCGPPGGATPLYLALLVLRN